MKPIITSLLDTDLYKFTMQQVVLHHFPGAEVEYSFKCRNPGIPLGKFIKEIDEQIDALCSLTMQDDELAYLASLRYMKPSYTSFLRGFKLNREFVTTAVGPNDSLDIRVKGPWFHTILFEVPLLSIVNEVYFSSMDSTETAKEGKSRLAQKSKLLTQQADPETFRFSDFGTRRRFSKDWQRFVVQTLAANHPRTFTGTSNVLLARDLNLTPIGTMAHEYLQAFQALGPSLRDFQKTAFDVWAREYRGDLGIALSDIVGVDAFLKDFDLYFCKLFDGARHDSGDPHEWGEKIIAHYQKHRIDPMTKTLVFSDGLDVKLALDLHKSFAGRTNPAYGIGTNLTNDLGHKPLNIVLKMVQCNGQPVAKISDSPGKSMCEDEWHMRNLCRTFDIPESRIEIAPEKASKPAGPKA